MDKQTPNLALARPFENSTQESMLSLCERELESSKRDIPSLIKVEFSWRSDAKNSALVDTLFKKFNLKKIRWHNEARKALRKLKIDKKNAKFSHNVYVVLLEDQKGIGLYVGETKYTPEERFNTHKAGGFTSSKKVEKKGKEILYSLFAHLNQIKDRETAENLEAEMVIALKNIEKRGLRSNNVFGSTKQKINVLINKNLVI